MGGDRLNNTSEKCNHRTKDFNVGGGDSDRNDNTTFTDNAGKSTQHSCSVIVRIYKADPRHSYPNLCFPKKYFILNIY